MNELVNPTCNLRIILMQWWWFSMQISESSHFHWTLPIHARWVDRCYILLVKPPPSINIPYFAVTTAKFKAMIDNIVANRSSFY